MKKVKNNKGITLITLAITIIIIIVLAGITINAIISDDGLLKNSRETVEETQKMQNSEEQKRDDFYNQLVSPKN